MHARELLASLGWGASATSLGGATAVGRRRGQSMALGRAGLGFALTRGILVAQGSSVAGRCSRGTGTAGLRQWLGSEGGEVAAKRRRWRGTLQMRAAQRLGTKGTRRPRVSYGWFIGPKLVTGGRH